MFPRSLLLLVLLLPLTTWAAQLPGIRLYQRGEYAKASRTLKQEINNPRRSEEERALARVYLAASLMALEKEDEAYEQLEELVRIYPEQRVDPALFPPELVELELKVRERLNAERLRQEAEQAELNRIAAAEEAARRKREQEEAARDRVTDGWPREEPQGPVSAAPPASPFRLRPEALVFSDVSGFIPPTSRSSIGFGLGLSAGIGMFDGSARALIGNRSLGVELDAGLLFGNGAFQPRLGLRGTVVPFFEGGGIAIGGGGSLGARLALSPAFTALVDVSYQGFAVPENQQSAYRSFVVVGSAGLGFNLL
ncbi:hypothetical protein NR798_07865 [Archangium gephyra]|uniref:tetratricopeptide repeat protein n=1 Tax=Archangium gephyra TaxID=48 RepID=UPI0035D51F0A